MDFQGSGWNYIPPIIYEEYPNDLAFSLIKKISQDASRTTINIESSNKSLRDAINQRFQEIQINKSIYSLLLHYFFGAQGAVIFQTLENRESFIFETLDFDNIIKLQGLSNLTFLSTINPPFFCLYRMESPFSKDFGRKFLNLGGQIVGNNKYYYIFENQLSLYSLIEPYCKAIDSLVKGVSSAGKRLGVLYAKKEGMNNMSPAEQQALRFNIDNIATSRPTDSVATSTGEEITNIAMNMSGLDDASDFLWHCISALSGIPQNILVGRGQGVSSSAEEDLRTYHAQIRQWQELFIRPFVSLVLKFLTSEKEGIMSDFKSSGDISFSFGELKEEGATEKQQRLSLAVNTIDTMVEKLGFTIDEASSIETEISNIINNRALKNENEKTGGEENDMSKDHVDEGK